MPFYAPRGNSLSDIRGKIRRGDTHELVEVEHMTMAECLDEYFQHPEAKMVQPDAIGRLSIREVQISNHVFIGKETSEVLRSPRVRCRAALRRRCRTHEPHKTDWLGCYTGKNHSFPSSQQGQRYAFASRYGGGGLYDRKATGECRGWSKVGRSIILQPRGECEVGDLPDLSHDEQGLRAAQPQSGSASRDDSVRLRLELPGGCQ